MWRALAGIYLFSIGSMFMYMTCHQIVAGRSAPSPISPVLRIIIFMLVLCSKKYNTHKLCVDILKNLTTEQNQWVQLLCLYN